MLFSEIIGQAEIKQQLAELVHYNRLSHALLFLGKEGSGSLPLALAFAQYVSSLPRTLTNEGPGLFGEPVTATLPVTPGDAGGWMQKQASFSRAGGMVHPDIHYSYPVVTKN